LKIKAEKKLQKTGSNYSRLRDQEVMMEKDSGLETIVQKL
jgi:hypothetical protein